jgi:DNA-binding winged helix-turn-helix (wHTH) protein
VRVRFADYDLDTGARRLVRGTRQIHLSPKAFELLKVLVENRPRAMTKQELLDKIWPGVFVSDASLARAVSEIREAIADHSRSEGFLQTVHAFGYRFATAGVVEAAGPAAVSDGPVCWLIGRDLEFRLADGEHIVGREPGVSIRLDSPRVSRNHARVTASGRTVSVEDLGSKNGTFVQGVRIQEPTRLEPGDDVQIGPVKLILRIVEGPGATETQVWSEDPR